MTSIGEVRISSQALKQNLASLRALVLPGAKVAAVVKGNAYGHGMAEVVPILEPHVDAFQVDDLDELRALRPLTRKRVLVFGYVPRERVAEAVELGGELAVYDDVRLEALAAARAKIHLKVDALLGRQGVLPGQIEGLIAALKRHPEIEVLTAYAHYANIEDTTDPVHALAQEEAFEPAFRKAQQAFPGIGRHLSATSGVLARNLESDLVRLGVGVYGLYPSAPLARSHAQLGLQPAMTWTSLLAQVKVLPARHPVGYGLTYLTPREMPVGIVPQGYADGYDRGLSNSGEVLVRGRRCPVIGRIAMNMFAIDLSTVPDAQPEDEVVLLGRQGREEVTAEEIASRIGTINYEVVTRVSPLLPRRVV